MGSWVWVLLCSRKLLLSVVSHPESKISYDYYQMRQYVRCRALVSLFLHLLDYSTILQLLHSCCRLLYTAVVYDMIAAVRKVKFVSASQVAGRSMMHTWYCVQMYT